jgi:hypothetical protein
VMSILLDPFDGSDDLPPKMVHLES